MKYVILIGDKGRTLRIEGEVEQTGEVLNDIATWLGQGKEKPAIDISKWLDGGKCKCTGDLERFINKWYKKGGWFNG